jgi:hypothetical protein
MMLVMTMPYDPYKPPSASLDGRPASDTSADVPPGVLRLLQETRPWVRLMAVVTIAMLVLMVIGVMVVISKSAAVGQGRVGAFAIIPAIIALGLCTPPALFLWQYASNIRRLQNGGGVPALEDAVSSQKSYWKYIGILMTVALGLYALMILIVALSGNLMR